MSHTFYVDESGDLGWSFDLPYGKGGSSRYLVVASVALPSKDDHRPERVMKDLYKASHWDPRKEKKWTDAPAKARLHFAQKAVQLATVHTHISYHAIVVNKTKVQKHLRDDGNKLYNYMVRLLLIHEMAKHGSVHFIPDPRSIKVESGNSMHDYLSIWLGYELAVPTLLRTQPIESKYCKNLQFADMLAGAVHSHFEFGRSDCFNRLAPQLRLKQLFF